jgi:hypothetical protein
MHFILLSCPVQINRLRGKRFPIQPNVRITAVHDCVFILCIGDQVHSKNAISLNVLFYKCCQQLQFTEPLKCLQKLFRLPSYFLFIYQVECKLCQQFPSVIVRKENRVKQIKNQYALFLVYTECPKSRSDEILGCDHQK